MRQKNRVRPSLIMAGFHYLLRLKPGSAGLRVYDERSEHIIIVFQQPIIINLACDFLFEEVTEENAAKLTQEQLDRMYHWIDNGGNLTMDSLTALHAAQRRAILDYLRECPLYERFELNGKQFLLTHSGLRNFEKDKPLESYETDDLLWNRPQLTDRYYDDVITIFGHTPTWYYGEEHAGKIIVTDTWIDIDVGAGYCYPPVLLRLDDMKQFTM